MVEGAGAGPVPATHVRLPLSFPFLLHKALEKGPHQPLQPPMRLAVSTLPRMPHFCTHCLLRLECFSLMENSCSVFKAQLGSSPCIKQSLRCPPPADAAKFYFFSSLTF